MSPFLVEIARYLGSVIEAHKESLTILGTGLSLAAVKNWPELIPKSPQEIWTWMRATSQTALPIYRMTGPPPPNPTPPVPNPEQPKK